MSVSLIVMRLNLGHCCECDHAAFITFLCSLFHCLTCLREEEFYLNFDSSEFPS